MANLRRDRRGTTMIIMMVMKTLILALALPTMANGFVILDNIESSIQKKTASTVVSTAKHIPNTSPFRSGRAASSSSRLFGGGFGGKTATTTSGSAGDDNKKKKNKEVKLKPKQQWDRYLSLKKETKIRVAVRVVEDESDEWLEVGRVKAKENQYIELAVARQRAIIAEHAKRLYPLQISNKKTLEWGYYQEKDEEWKTVDKSILDDDANKVEGLEKLIGFEGRPDPSTGFYCVYDEGRLKFGEESSFK